MVSWPVVVWAVVVWAVVVWAVVVLVNMAVAPSVGSPVTIIRPPTDVVLTSR
jgi:hypothetical protein